MSTEQILSVAVSLLVVVVASGTAFAVQRSLRRTGHALEAAALKLHSTAGGLPMRLDETRSWLAGADERLEHTVWQLENVDATIDRVLSTLPAKRAASDRLRVRLVEGRLTVARLRQLVRLMMRLGELRREFL